MVCRAAAQRTPQTLTAVERWTIAGQLIELELERGYEHLGNLGGLMPRGR